MTAATAPSMHELDRAFEEGCLELYRRIDVSHALCGSFLQRVETDAQKASMKARQEQEERVRTIQAARKTGDLGPYMEMLERDRLAAATFVEPSAVVKVRREPSLDAPSVSQPVQPLLDVPTQPQRVKPASFDQTSAVIELARRLAIQDYHRHVFAAAEATTPEQKAAAVAQVVEAEKAARMADSALQSLVSAQAEQRSTTVNLLRGDSAAAAQSARNSGHHLDIVADKLERFGDVAPRSRLFHSTLNAVMKADEVAGRLEEGAARTVESFSKGLKAFAQRVRELGASVARTPTVVADMAKTARVSVETAAASAYASAASSIGGILSRASAKVDAAKQSTTESAWALVDDAADFAARARDAVKGAASEVDLHVRATAGLAGGLLSRVAGAIANGYSEEVGKVQASRQLFGARTGVADALCAKWSFGPAAEVLSAGDWKSSHTGLGVDREMLVRLSDSAEPEVVIFKVRFDGVESAQGASQVAIRKGTVEVLGGPTTGDVESKDESTVSVRRARPC